MPIGEGQSPGYSNIDALGRATSDTIVVDGAALVRSYTHDSFGNLLTSNDRNGRDIAYTYDNLGRRTQEAWGSGSSHVVDYAFTALGELEEARTSNGPTIVSDYDYTYDVGRRRSRGIDD
ncbi:MAG: hypothetical protein DWQ31_19160 [Planctomycetota bacterium]|nr:MAG: hypothetical protein DWQ31_19160 [Planctomycetota bacterium]REJ94274.1 MAG: hypothetical protein DWQ35_08645 [Planctomycetota bacterium]REK42188.1 MAG: hypothetical protein DWQ46_14195 [Planctomycetota bacterium]